MSATVDQEAILRMMAGDYGWSSAFAEAGLDFGEVAHITAHVEGEYDEADWLAIGRLSDGRWFSMEAGCSYTGWDCQASGEWHASASARDLWLLNVTRSARERLWPEIGPGEIGFLLSIVDQADVVRQMGKDDRRRFLAGFMTEHDKLEADGR